MQLTKVIVALFAAGAMAGPVIRGEQQCGTNEIYKEEHKDCPPPNDPSCSTPGGGPQLTVCGKSGCYCAPGFVRNFANQCVKRSECSKCYGANESLKDCGGSCVKTCKTPEPQVCTLECRLGCQCNEGYVRKYSGNPGGYGECVKLDKCPADTDLKKSCNGDNEEWQTAGTSCPDNCFKTNQICDKKGNQGCYCKKGYVRLNFDGTGKCVKLDSCPSKTQEKPCSASTAAASS